MGVADTTAPTIFTTENIPYSKFASAFLYIRDKRGRLRPFVRNSIQRRYRGLKNYAKALGRRRFLVLKYRRGGITTEEQATSYHECLQPGQKCLTLAHTREDTQVIFDIARTFYQEMTPRLRPKKTRSEKRELDFPAPMNSRFYIGTARATSSARGSTLQRVHGSEVAFWPLRPEQFGNLLSSLTEACEQGEVVLETTANGHNHYYELWKEAKQNPDSEWVPIFLPWFQDDRNAIPIVSEGELEELLATLSSEEEELIRKHSMAPEQVKWRRRKKGELRRLFLQEYPEDDEGAFLITGTCFFDKANVLEHLSRCKNPQSTRLGGRLLIYDSPVPGMDYVAGSDVAEGLVGEEHDKSVTYILERRSGKAVAVLTCQWKPHEFAQRSLELVKEYNNAFWGIELQQSGHAVVNQVDNVDLYSNLYKHEHYDEHKKVRYLKTGWPTNKKTRPIMLDDLALAFEQFYTSCPHEQLFTECKTFTGNHHGKFAASSGNHDDHIMAYAIAWQMRNHRPRLPSVTVM